MEYLIIILFLVILFLLLKKKSIKEKFSKQLLSPEILEVVKSGSTANITFKRAKNSSEEKTNQKSEYLIFYIDEQAPDRGVWVQRKVICTSDKCNFKLEKLSGIKYHLTMVESHDGKISPVKKIIKFSDTQPYKLIEFNQQSQLNAQPIKYESNLENVEPIEESHQYEMKVDLKEKAPPPIPYVECGNNPKVKYVKDKSDMDGIEYKSNCEEDKEISRLEEKVSRSLWNEFSKGYLTLDLI